MYTVKKLTKGFLDNSIVLNNKVVKRTLKPDSLKLNGLSIGVRHFYNENYVYKKDIGHDTWFILKYNEVTGKFYGDCESYALTTVERLYMEGVHLEDIALVYGESDEGKHVWLRLTHNRREYLIDYNLYITATYDEMLIERSLVPIHTVNLGYLKAGVTNV